MVFLRETPSKCPWLVSIAITSEKLAFDRFFGGGWEDFILLGCVRIFQEYFPEISRTPGKIFSEFFFRPIKFSRNFFDGSKSFFVSQGLEHTLSNEKKPAALYGSIFLTPGKIFHRFFPGSNSFLVYT